MSRKLIERFQKFENILLIYRFLTKTIKWLCENFYNKKLEMVFCEYDDHINILNDYQMKKICNQRKLLTKFNEITNN